MYNGAGDNVVLPGMPDLGACSNIVLRLSQTIPDFHHYILYFDNFYTSIPLLVYLRSRGIYSLGTVRNSRIPTCKLPLDAELKNEPRGYSSEYVTSAKGVPVSAVIWKDNKCVRLLSTYVGIHPFDSANTTAQPAKAPRYDRKQKKYLEIDCPQIIREYNKHMDGVDLMDGLVGRYRIRVKSKDIMKRLFFHFVDVAVTNAYILQKRIYSERCNDSSFDARDDKPLELPVFRRELAESLMTFNENRQRGRPSSSLSAEARSSPVSMIGKRAKHLPVDLRFDGLDHFPRFSKKMWCKCCKKSQTCFSCSKCELNLCITSAKNCFLEYHTKK